MPQRHSFEDKSCKNDLENYDTPEKRQYYTDEHMKSKAKNLREIIQPTMNDFVKSKSDGDTVKLVDLGCGPGSATAGVLEAIDNAAEEQGKELTIDAVCVDRYDWKLNFKKENFKNYRCTKGILPTFNKLDIREFVQSGENTRKFDIAVLNYVGFTRDGAKNYLPTPGFVGDKVPGVVKENGIVLVNDNNIEDVRKLSEEFGFEMVDLDHLRKPDSQVNPGESILQKYTVPTTAPKHELSEFIKDKPKQGEVKRARRSQAESTG